MARARNIKPAIMDNEELAELSPMTRLLFVYLWMLADREGRLEDRPKRIAAQALPYDRAADVGAMLDDLHKAGFIARYEVEGMCCVQILNFSKHQTPHVREAASDLPSLEAAQAKEVPRHNLGSDKASPRSPDPGFSDPGLLIADTAPPAPVAAASASPRKKATQTRMPSDFSVSERVAGWAKSKGYDRLPEHLEAFKRKAIAKGYTYASWDDAFMEAIREDWAKLRGRGANGAAPPPEQAAAADPDSRSAIEAEGVRKGIGPWDEVKEQWHVYKARVRGPQPIGMTLDKLAAMAAARQEVH